MKGLNPEVYTDIVITEGLETPDGPLDSRGRGFRSMIG